MLLPDLDLVAAKLAVQDVDMLNPLAAFKKRIQRATRPKKPKGLSSYSAKKRKTRVFGGMKFGTNKGY